MPERDILSDIRSAEAEYADAVLGRHQALAEGDVYSRRRIVEIREAIALDPPPATGNVHCLATAGSIARHEASGLSDLDLIVTTHPEGDGRGAPDISAVKAWRNALCAKLGIDEPNPDGVFADPTCRSLVEGISGRAGEDYANIAKRVLFLLESQWLLNESDHESLLDRVIDRYTSEVAADPRKNFVFLLNDVIRFFRQLCVNYAFTTSETPDGKWPIRNVKLRHSRVIMYFSMVATIGALSTVRTDDKIPALKLMTRMHPLKRLYVAYRLSNDGGFTRIAGYYNTFLLLLGRDDVRRNLKALEYDDRYNSPEFAQLKANSDALSAELLRFYEARRGGWDDRFFEYMII